VQRLGIKEREMEAVSWGTVLTCDGAGHVFYSIEEERVKMPPIVVYWTE
jgi:hypothetical protein